MKNSEVPGVKDFEVLILYVETEFRKILGMVRGFDV